MLKKIKKFMKNIGKNTKRFIIDEKIYLISVVNTCLKTVLFYLFASIYPDYGTPFVTLAVTMFFLLPVVYAKEKRTKIILEKIISFTLSSLMLANIIYYQYSSNFLSLFQLSNAKYGKEISESLGSLLKKEYILFYIDYIIYILYYFVKLIKIIFVKLSKKKYNLEDRKKEDDERVEIKTSRTTWKQKLFVTIFSVIGVIVALETPEELLRVKFWSKQKLIAQSTLYGYHYYDAISFFFKNNAEYKSMDEVRNVILDTPKKEDGEVYLEIDNIAKGKNVILLQLEAIQQFLMYKQINGVEITPNLNKFLSENVYFTNMNAQGLGSTADSEHTVLNSLYPLENGSVYQFYAGNKWCNLLNEPQKAGYYTSFMHANSKGFWNRYNVYSKSIGVNKFEDIDSFLPLDEMASHWLADEKFYERAVNILKQYKAPYLVNMVSVSSHYPFGIEGLQNESEKVKVDPGKYKDTLFGNYVRAANYADYAFGKFMDTLKENGMYDDTLIVVYGDHYAMNLEDPGMIDYMQSIGEPFNKIGLVHNQTNVACGIHIPGVSHMQIDTPVGKTDIKPTVLRMIGVEDTFSLGKNMFSKSDYIYTSNYNIITSKYEYTNGIWYVLSTGTELDLNSISEEERTTLDNYIVNMKKEISVSESIIKRNLLKDINE